MRFFAILIVACILSGCGIQRSNQAAEAKEQLVGQSRAQVLSCMGAPAAATKADNIEVWSYPSGGSETAVLTSQNYTAWNGGYNGTTTYNPYGAYSQGSYSGSSYGYGTGIGSTSRYYCVVNLVFSGDRVEAVKYVGNTGKLLTPDSECAYAVRGCLPQ